MLIIAETGIFGTCLVDLLRDQGYTVTIVESCDRLSDPIKTPTSVAFDLVIATNTSVPPAKLPGIIPDIKSLHPRARIIVLSGYCPDQFVTDLKQKGADGFLPLPFEESALLQEAAAQLSTQTI